MTVIPYSDDELKVIGTYVAANSIPENWKALFGSAPIYNTPITAKENLWKAIKKEGAMWFPTGNDMTYVESRLNLDHVARAEVMDQGPAQTLEEKGGKDLFGIEWVFVPVAGGSMVKPGTPFLADANEWYDKVVFPDVDGNGLGRHGRTQRSVQRTAEKRWRNIPERSFRKTYLFHGLRRRCYGYDRRRSAGCYQRSLRKTLRYV